MERNLAFDRVVEFARDLIRIPSPSGGEGEVAERVIGELTKLRFDEVWSDDAGNVVGMVKGKGLGPSIMLSSHLDVVDAGDPAAWEFDPYGGEVAGGCLHGRGAVDVKGPMAIQTYAAASFLENRPAGDLYLSYTVHEESGGWGMSHLMQSSGVRPDLVILAEATNGDLCIGHRGRVDLVVDVRGSGGHASAPERARSPLNLLPEILQALRDWPASLPDPGCLPHATATPTAVEAGARDRNVIPHRLRMLVDCRVPPGYTDAGTAAALGRFMAHYLRDKDVAGYSVDVRCNVEVQQAYTSLRRERSGFTPGFLVPDTSPVATAAARTIETMTGQRPRVRPWNFSTDGGHTCGTHGVTTIGYAPGQERFAHTHQERLELEPACTVYGVYPALICVLQGLGVHEVAPPPLIVEEASRPRAAAPALAHMPGVS